MPSPDFVGIVMSNKFVLIGGAVAVAGIAFLANAGEQRIDKNRAMAVERFQITETEFPVMDACEKAMSHNNVEFKSGVPNISGCACMTREIADHIQPAEMELAAGLLPIMITAAKPGNEKRAEKGALETYAFFKQHNTSEARSIAVYTASVEATAKCSNHDFHLTAEQKTQIAEIDARKDAKSREAIEQAVQRGLITREKADERLALIDRANR